MFTVIEIELLKRTHPTAPSLFDCMTGKPGSGDFVKQSFKKLTPCPLSLKEREGVEFPELTEIFE